ncbi:MAG TPA: GNAT family N-acetyltransferase [Stellaceae bacterium]|nr:GNAT family N-acetyltransferase [Stellaceae bacterium]
MASITAHWRRFEDLSAAELYALLAFRQGIFVVEQRCPYPDLDGLDQSARHLLLAADGELVGCLRVIPQVAEVRIGRVAVAAPLRGQGLGRRLMEEALRVCRERHAVQRVMLTAQFHLVRFYESFGFSAVSEPYDDFGLTHIDMAIPL